MKENKMDKLLFGCAYYLEYAPYDRLETDINMMIDAGFNVIRIAESTWSTLEPFPDVYNFDYIDKVLEIAKEKNIMVIVGTPTYAIPSWLVQLDKNVLALTKKVKISMGLDRTWILLILHIENVQKL